MDMYQNDSKPSKIFKKKFPKRKPNMIKKHQRTGSKEIQEVPCRIQGALNPNGSRWIEMIDTYRYQKGDENQL